MIARQTDARAMAQFAYRIRPTRVAMLVEGPTEREAGVMARHVEYLRDLAERGQVLLAGRTLTADARTFGIVVFEAASEDAARRVMQDDPAVSEGVMQAALWPFRVAFASARGPQAASGR